MQVEISSTRGRVLASLIEANLRAILLRSELYRKSIYPRQMAIRFSFYFQQCVINPMIGVVLQITPVAKFLSLRG
jgi:hypothetical protein